MENINVEHTKTFKFEQCNIITVTSKKWCKLQYFTLLVQTNGLPPTCLRELIPSIIVCLCVHLSIYAFHKHVFGQVSVKYKTNSEYFSICTMKKRVNSLKIELVPFDKVIAELSVQYFNIVFLWY